jgi:hypothetical protein
MVVQYASINVRRRVDQLKVGVAGLSLVGNTFREFMGYRNDPSQFL